MDKHVKQCQYLYRNIYKYCCLSFVKATIMTRATAYSITKGF